MQKQKDSIYSFYKKLIALRKEKDIIAEGTIEFLEKKMQMCWHTDVTIREKN